MEGTFFWQIKTRKRLLKARDFSVNWKPTFYLRDPWDPNGSLTKYHNCPYSSIMNDIWYHLRVFFRASFKIFKTRLLGRGLHIFTKSVSFRSPTDVGSHNPPHSVSSLLDGTHSFLWSIWTPTKSTLLGPASLFAHCSMCTPLRGSAFSLAYYSVSGSNTISNSPSLLLLLVNIVLVRGFPQTF